MLHGYINFLIQVNKSLTASMTETFRCIWKPREYGSIEGNLIGRVGHSWYPILNFKDKAQRFNEAKKE